MTDNSIPELDPSVQLEMLEKFEATVGEYTQFLMEKGVDLFFHEPEPDFDEYQRRYSVDPPSHLATADKDVRLAAAFEAWENAVRIRAELQATAASYMIKVLALATHRTLCESFVTYGSQPRSLVDMLTEVREDIVKQMWLDGLWHEPWISLVNREFPGPEPTAIDIEEFESVREAKDQQSRATHALLESQRERIHSFLWEHGLMPSIEDAVAIQSISFLSVDHLTGTRVNRIDERMRAKEIVAQATEPQHKAWADLLNEFFPLPEG